MWIQNTFHSHLVGTGYGTVYVDLVVDLSTFTQNNLFCSFIRATDRCAMRAVLANLSIVLAKVWDLIAFFPPQSTLQSHTIQFACEYSILRLFTDYHLNA